MKIANCEQSCCLSQNSALRGRVCWQRRCYSVCKAVIPLLGLMLTSRVSSGALGVPAALGAVHCRTPAMGFPSWPGAGFRQPAEPPPGQRCQHTGHETGGSVPRKGHQDCFASEGKNPFLFVHLLCQHRARDLAKTHSLCSLWGNDQALALALFSLTPDYNLFLAHS